MGREEENVRRLLRNAFADVPCPERFKAANACRPVTHEVSLELRRDFYNYEREEIHYMLPSILADLMDTRSGDDIETQDAERLIIQLDPFFLEDGVIRKVKLKQFSKFTAEQAQSVCEWLRVARTWKDLSRFTDYVDAALAYWCKRASE